MWITHNQGYRCFLQSCITCSVHSHAWCTNVKTVQSSLNSDIAICIFFLVPFLCIFISILLNPVTFFFFISFYVFVTVLTVILTAFPCEPVVFRLTSWSICNLQKMWIWSITALSLYIRNFLIKMLTFALSNRHAFRKHSIFTACSN